MKKLGLLLATLLFASIGWGQNTYTKFAPANGVLKGSTTTYVTTAAADADIIGLWSGSCSNVTYLRGDGTCATPPGTGGGTVNSVALAAPTVFSVSGSPVTNTGTLTLAFATGQTANEFLATPNGSTGAVGLRVITTADLPAIPLTTGVTGTLPTGNGGTGEAGTFTGVRKANTASADTSAVAADVYGLWSGTCSSATFLRGDGSCAAPAAGGTVTSVGLSWTGSGITVGGTPVTTSGTLALSGTLNATTGGTGEAGTITGVIKGNATSAMTAAVAADVYGLWSGTCSSTTFLRGDGSCATPGGASGANPSALVGLTTVNGTATTYMRSDASPGLDLSISPTVTGTWSFTNATNSSTIFRTSTAADFAQVEIAGAATSATGICTSDTAAKCQTNESANDTDFFHSGTLHISTSAGVDQMTIASGGNVVIPTPGSGVALLVNSVQGVGTEFSGPNTGAGFNIDFFDATNSAFRGFIGIGTNTVGGAAATDFAISPGTSGSVVIGTAAGGAIATRFGPAGNVSINAPTSGVALSVGNATSAVAIQASGPILANATGAAQIVLNSVGSNFGLIEDPSSQVWCLGYGTSSTGALGTCNLTWSTGGVQVGAPTGGDKGTGAINAQSIFVNNSAVCTASGANCPATAALLFSTAQVANTGSICTVSNNVNIGSCTISSTGVVVVNFSASYSSFKNCTANSAPGVPAVMTMVAGGTSSVTVESFDGSAIGSPVNVGFTVICFGT